MVDFPNPHSKNLLDPRTFPVHRIADLVFALPPPGESIAVADALGAEEAVVWLNAHGRPAHRVPAPENPQPTRLWRPSPGLVPIVETLIPGTAIDLGCGTGRDAVFLALHGWTVTAVDHLPDALARAGQLAALHNVTLDLRVCEIDRDPIPGPFDLVTAFRYLPSLDKMANSLSSGGSLLVETFTDGERVRTGKPRDPAMVLPSAGPPPLPDGLILRDYSVRTVGGRELACLWAVRNYALIEAAVLAIEQSPGPTSAIEDQTLEGDHPFE